MQVLDSGASILFFVNLANVKTCINQNLRQNSSAVLLILLAKSGIIHPGHQSQIVLSIHDVSYHDN
jgi:hypothetical protein